MFLKKINLSGFKSFADQISMTFDQQHVTGIVGPNGSGKSNIVDAVRWVMGEQNAKMLRGEKSTDIIFSGSQKRKALAMAEVSLVFDNSSMSQFCPPEYRHEEEITLTRRMYADGQRELSINKKPCRLKDILEFFITSGIGGRSYSMIQQGQVERILQAKPEQLREIIEEAAGTTIFRKKHLETQKKLNLTQENLTRISDVIQEVKTRLDELSEQAEKAKKWKQLNAQVRQEEIDYICQSYLALKENTQFLLKQKDLLIEEEKSNLVQQTETEGKHSSFLEKLEKADPEIVVLTETLAQIREKLATYQTKLENYLELLSAGEDGLLRTKKSFNIEKKALDLCEKQKIKVKREIKSIEEQSQKDNDVIDTFENILSTLEDKSIEFTKKKEDLNQELMCLDKENEANTIRFESRDSQAEVYKKDIQEFQINLERLESECSKAKIVRDSSEVKFSKYKISVDEIKNKKQEYIRVIEKIEEIISIEKEHIDLNKNKSIEYTTQLKIFENSKHRSDLLKEYLEKNKLQKEVIFLADGLKFNKNATKTLSEQQQLSVACWSDRIIFRNKEIVEKIIEDKEDLKIKSLSISECFSQDNGKQIKKWASAFSLRSILVALDTSLLCELTENVFSRVYFLQENIDLEKCLIDLPKGVVLLDCTGRVYTNNLDVELILQESSYTAAKKEEEAIKIKLKRCYDKILEKTIKIKKQQEQKKFNEIKVNDFEENLEKLNTEQIILVGELQANKLNVSNKELQLDNLKQDHKRIEEKAIDFIKEKNKLEKKKSLYQSQRKHIQSFLDEIEEDIETCEEEKNENKSQIKGRFIDKTTAAVKLISLKESFEQVELQYDLIKERKENFQQEVDSWSGSFKEAKINQKQTKELIKALAEERITVEKKITKKRSEHADVSNKLKKLEKELTSLRKKIVNNNTKKTEVDFKLEKVLEKSEETICLSREKFSFDLESTDIKINNNFQKANTLKSIESINRKIQDLGAINMVAIDEYEKHHKRYEFISSQKEEVLSSVDLLVAAIEDIEMTSADKLLNTITIINREFEQLFPILFPNGEGHVVLTNPDNPLESGVEIIVRLPGKAMQSMRLFSGGEKALTAISLIFALLKSKPTPFCFLDEVDAALDETNVTRYNRVLQTLSDQFQFIIITHRRRTMEVLDTLYGVTMQEPGVSKVVGVDLSKSLPVHLQKSFLENHTPDISVPKI
jgi:chromosome segregation protein